MSSISVHRDFGFDGKRPDNVRLIKTRGTWNHDTGYSFTEEYQGGRREILRAAGNPFYVCGASQFIIDEDPHDRTATLTVTYANRNKALARANLAQAEEFKSTWTLEKITEQVPLHRHPAYGELRQLPVPFAVGRKNEFQFLQFLNDLLNTWEQAYNARLRKHITVRLTGIPDPTATTIAGQTDVTREFWEVMRREGKQTITNPETGELVTIDFGRPLYVPPDAATGSTEEALRITRLIDDYVLNYLNHRRTVLLERNVLRNVSVIPPNSRYSGLQNIGNQITNSASIAELIRSDLNLILRTRSFTPADCLDITANKRVLVRDLISQYGDTRWFIEPQTTKEVRNGAFEVRRNFVQRHFFEVNETVTPVWVHPNIRRSGQ